MDFDKTIKLLYQSWIVYIRVNENKISCTLFSFPLFRTFDLLCLGYLDRSTRFIYTPAYALDFHDRLGNCNLASNCRLALLGWL
jgi:hypothetical protein